MSLPTTAPVIVKGDGVLPSNKPAMLPTSIGVISAIVKDNYRRCAAAHDMTIGWRKGKASYAALLQRRPGHCKAVVGIGREIVARCCSVVIKKTRHSHGQGCAEDVV